MLKTVLDTIFFYIYNFIIIAGLVGLDENSELTPSPFLMCSNLEGNTITNSLSRVTRVLYVSEKT